MSSLAPSEHYLATVTWVEDGRIAVQWLDRDQQNLFLRVYSLNGSKWNPEKDLDWNMTTTSGWIGRVSMPGGFLVFTNKTIRCIISIKSKNIVKKKKLSFKSSGIFLLYL